MECFRALNHYLTVDGLKVAYERVKPHSAPGVDGPSWAEYGQQLDENWRRLRNRVQGGSYFAPPVKRVHISKGDGKETRPLGRPTSEDPVLQRAIVLWLEPIFEQDCQSFSSGFWPGRSAQEALACIGSQCLNQNIEWMLAGDRREYFDTRKQAWLRQFLRARGTAREQSRGPTGIMVLLATLSPCSGFDGKCLRPGAGG